MERKKNGWNVQFPKASITWVFDIESKINKALKSNHYEFKLSRQKIAEKIFKPIRVAVANGWDIGHVEIQTNGNNFIYLDISALVLLENKIYDKTQKN